MLTRKDLQREGPRLHAKHVPASHGAVHEVTSGGSTGIPVRVRKTALQELLWNAVHIREEIWHRDDIGGTIARLRGVPGHFTPAQMAQVRSPDGLVLPDWGPPTSLIWRTGKIAIIDFTMPIPGQAEFLRRLNPDYIFTNPANLRLLIAHCRDHPITLPALRSIWTLSEIVDTALRETCRAVFGVGIVDNYTASETGYMALQCTEHPHYHVQSELVLLEVLRPDGAPCVPGETGRVVVTPLHSFAMPLLRYEIGDEAEQGAPCSCGRGLPVLTRIVGRSLDTLALPDGRRRRTDFSHYRLSRVLPVQEYQLIQRSLQRLEMLLVVSRPLTETEEAEIRDALEVEFGNDFRIDLTYVPAIARTAAGKLRPFISDLD